MKAPASLGVGTYTLIPRLRASTLTLVRAESGPIFNELADDQGSRLKSFLAAASAPLKLGILFQTGKGSNAKNSVSKRCQT